MRPLRRTLAAVSAAGALAVGLGACSAEPEEAPAQAAPERPATEQPTTPGADDHPGAEHSGAAPAGALDETVTAELVAANLATAAFQDVELAQEAGWGSTLDELGCFEDAEAGGMGLHYVNPDLMDATVAVEEPEALVYELDHQGEIVALVAHEYIVPVEAWTADEPPRLFGRDFHQHPVLPLWVLHAWIWKDNPSGVFEDHNPTVRPCPEGVPVFGVDLP